MTPASVGKTPEHRLQPCSTNRSIGFNRHALTRAVIDDVQASQTSSISKRRVSPSSRHSFAELYIWLAAGQRLRRVQAVWACDNGAITLLPVNSKVDCLHCGS